MAALRDNRNEPLAGTRRIAEHMSASKGISGLARAAGAARPHQSSGRDSMSVVSQSWELSSWEYRLLSISSLPVGEVHRRISQLRHEGWQVERVVCDEAAAPLVAQRIRVLLKRRRRAS